MTDPQTDSQTDPHVDPHVDSHVDSQTPKTQDEESRTPSPSLAGESLPRSPDPQLEIFERMNVQYEDKVPVGFVFINRTHSLLDLRQLMHTELDFDFTTYRFMSHGFPISRKQEPKIMAANFLPSITISKEPPLPSHALPFASPATTPLGPRMLNRHFEVGFKPATFPTLPSRNVHASEEFFREEAFSKSELPKVTFTPEELASCTGRILVTGDARGHTQLTFRELADYMAVRATLPSDSRRPVWIDFEAPTPKTLRIIGKMFSMHHLTVEDATSHQDGREKWEIFDNYLYLLIHVLSSDDIGDDVIATSALSIMLFKDIVLSIHGTPSPTVLTLVDKLSNQPNKWSLPHPSWVVHSLVDAAVDLMIPVVDSLTTEVDNLDDLVHVLSQFEQNDLLRRMSNARIRLSSAHHKLEPKKNMLHAMMTRDDLAHVLRYVSSHDLSDVLDHVVFMQQKIEFARETLASLQSNYMAKVSLELALSSNDINIVMKKLSAVATIVLPLSLVAGVFGMNVTVPGQTGEHNDLYWFWGLVIAMALVAVAMTYFFKKRHWF